MKRKTRRRIRREITEKDLLGMESTGHRTWCCGCHRNCSTAPSKQEIWKIKDINDHKKFERAIEIERCWEIQGFVERSVGTESVLLRKPELAAASLHALTDSAIFARAPYKDSELVLLGSPDALYLPQTVSLRAENGRSGLTTQRANSRAINFI